MAACASGVERRLGRSRHRISEDAFDALAAGVEDPTVVDQLRAAERSRRRILLRAFLDATRAYRGAAGPLAEVDVAWDLLVRVEEVDAERTGRLLDHPQVGAWVARTLRRMRGQVYDDVPLWVDVGYLHCLAAAGAAGCGLCFEIDVPLRHGRLVLPTVGSLGMAVRDPWETAVVRGRAGRLHVVTRQGESVLPGPFTRPAAAAAAAVVVVSSSSDRPAGAWYPTVVLDAVSDDRRLSVLLEDADPFRRVPGPARPARVSAATADRWRRTLADAWTLLVRHDRGRAEEMAAVLSVLVPSPASERLRPRSASSGDSFGSAELSEPDNGTQLAETLVHEFQHMKLGALINLVDLFEDGCPELFYAPWRDDPRPLHGQFHGVYAFFGVAAFWRREREAGRATGGMSADFEFALVCRQVVDGLDQIRDRPELTDLGRRFLTGLAMRTDGWLGEPVAAQAARFAELARRSHRAGWRIRHLRPAPETVRELLSAWRSEAESDAESESEADGPRAAPPVTAAGSRPAAGAPLDTRTTLIRLWWADRDAFRALQRSGAPGGTVQGATGADLLLVAGDADTAGDRYRSAAVANPADVDAWTGLGLAMAATADAAAPVLLDRPHLALAVARAVWTRTGRAPDPVRLARWLATDPAGLGPGGAGPDRIEPSRPDRSVER